jgi:hypothetical protein
MILIISPRMHISPSGVDRIISLPLGAPLRVFDQNHRGINLNLTVDGGAVLGLGEITDLDGRLGLHKYIHCNWAESSQ